MAVTLRSLHTHLLRMSQDMAVEARETRMGSHMGNALTMSYGFEMNFSRSAFFFDGTFSRFMFSFHLIGGLCVFVGLHRLCSRGSLRDRDLRDLRASTVQQKRRFRYPALQADPHAGNLILTEDGRLAFLDFGLMGASKLSMLCLLSTFSICFSYDLLHSTLCLDFLLGTHLPYS